MSRTTLPLSVVTVFWLLPLRRFGGWFWPSGASFARSSPRCSSISVVSARSASAFVSSERMPSLPNRSSADRPSISWSKRSLSMLIRGSPFRAVTTPEHKIQDSPGARIGARYFEAPLLPPQSLGQVDPILKLLDIETNSVQRELPQPILPNTNRDLSPDRAGLCAW